MFIHVGPVPDCRATYAGNAPVLIVHTINLLIMRSVLQNDVSKSPHSKLIELHPRFETTPREKQGK